MLGFLPGLVSLPLGSTTLSLGVAAGPLVVGTCPLLVQVIVGIML